MRKAYFDTAFLVRLKGNDIFQNFLVNALFQSKSSNNHIVFHSMDNKKAHDIICSILCEYYDPKVCSSEQIDSYMIILFAELLRIYNSDTPSRNWMTCQRTEVAEIIDYIYKNYKSISLKTAAEHFNLTEKYISSKIRKQAGYKFMDIVHQIRMEQACNLLLYTYLPVEQVACEVGYSNINFFYQLFKRSYGITPKSYQQMHEGIKI
jgi:YesN/AraC family two-component response regulator